ncbi:MAG: hypothetical protein ABIM62_00575 [candidate division WOR-3 bacterium]
MKAIILLTILNFLCAEEFFIDTTGFIRPKRFDQVSPDIIFDDSVFIVAWCNRPLYYPYPTISMCRIKRTGALIEIAANDLTSPDTSNRKPLLRKGDTTSILIWHQGVNIVGTTLKGKTLKKGGEIINNINFPSKVDSLPIYQTSISWDKNNFFIAIIANIGGRLDVRVFKIDPLGNPMDTTILIKKAAEEGIAIEWGDSIGLVIWQKLLLPHAEIWGTMIDHEGNIIDSSLIYSYNAWGAYMYDFKLIYIDSLFFLFFKNVSAPESVYFQRIDYLGNVIDTIPKRIFLPFYSYTGLEISNSDSLIYIFYGAALLNNMENILLYKVKKNGEFDSIPTQVFPSPIKPSEYISAYFNGENFYLVWTDKRDTASYGYNKGIDLYGSIVTQDGVPFDSAGKLISFENYKNFNQLRPFISFTGSKFLIMWEDERRMNKDIWFKLFDKYGFPIGNPHFIAVDIFNERKPIIANSPNNFLVLWEKRGNIYGEIVDSSGIPSYNEIPVAIQAGEQINPHLYYSDSIYFCVWEDQRNGFYPEIYGARIKINGEIIDTNGILISTAPGGSFYPKICAIDTIFLVVWEDRRNGNPDIYACRVTKSGIVLEPHGIPVCTEAHYQKYPATCKLNDKFIIIWQDLRNGNYDLYFSRIDLNGNVLEPDGIPFIATGDEEISPFIPASNIPFVMWYRISSHYDFLGGIIDSSGNLLYYKKLIPDASYRQNPSIFIMPDSTYFIVYEKRDQNEVLFKIYGYIDRFINIKENYATRDFGELRIFPTITNDKINITPLSNYPVIIYIYDQTGRKVNEVFLRKKFLSLRELNLSTGIYYLKVFDKLHKIVYIK